MCGTCVDLRKVLEKNMSVYDKTEEQWKAQKFIPQTDAEKALFAYTAHMEQHEALKQLIKDTKKNLGSDEIFVIQIDYKEKISLSASKEEVGSIFYNKKYASMLNITFIRLEQNEDGVFEPRTYHTNYITENNNQTAFSVAYCFKKFLNSGHFDGINKVYVRSDNGAQFCSKGTKLFEILYLILA
jgi:hypothetical protein